MSFRNKIFLSITATVVIAVWIVAGTVSAMVTKSFEKRDAQRTDTLVSQFRQEFERRGVEIARRLDTIVSSDTVQRIAVDFSTPQPDTAQFYSVAQTLAKEQSLDFLELLSPDGEIISSAEWPARFGYRETWLAQPGDWQKTFLRREELANGSALGLITVRTVKTGNGLLYIAGGQRLDEAFLDSLPAAEGMHAQLYRNFEPFAAPESLGSKTAADLVQDVRRQPREVTRTSAEATVTAIPLMAADNQLLAILLVVNSRAELASLRSSIRATALAVGTAGVLLALLLSFWTASRVTKPLRQLTASVRKVAGGNWQARAPIESRDEVGQLARDFNHMTEQLVEQRDRMIQAERVAAWRELARRLAHELKNPLFPLQITIENLQRVRTASPEQFDEVFRECTSTLLAELDNLKTIIGRFSDFAKMPAPQPESLDLNQLVREVLKLFEAQVHAPGHPPIETALALEADPSTVSADPDQIRRALSNLILNGLDAMPKGGTLTVATKRVDDRVALEVADTGEGLTPEECERLFTPYYTTKQHGTGLGLAIVQSVVSDHKGTISVHSEPGKGTTFRIELMA